MNNKGFTLVELIISIMLLSAIFIIAISSLVNTFSLTEETEYEILINNIKTQAQNYIIECDGGLINCKNDYTWSEDGKNKKTSFSLAIMKKYKYFNTSDYINPINKNDLSNCLIINVEKDEFKNLIIKIDDSKCK